MRRQNLAQFIDQLDGHWVLGRSAQGITLVGLAIAFWLDHSTALGIAQGGLYPPLVLVAAGSRQPRWVVVVAAASLVLTALGLMIAAPAPPGLGDGVLNRLLSAVAIAITAGLTLALMRQAHRAQAAQQALDQAQATLQEQQRMLQIASEIGHDFNSLLTVVLGNAELLSEMVEDAPHLQPLTEIIGDAARRGADLAQRLLAFAHRPALEPDGGDINQLISTGESELILLVDDDDLVRGYAHKQLLSLGYRVLVAENGPVALAIVRQRDDIDLLFTDVVMPGGMGGANLVDLAQQIRPCLKVLYTSGYAENAIAHQGQLDHGVQILSKPYSRAELSQKIREALGADP